MALTLCFKSSGDKGECICLREGVQKNLLSLDEKFIETFEKKTLIFQISILDMKSAKMVFSGQMRGNGHC